MIDRTYIECACWSPDHTISVWKDSSSNQVYLTTHLTKFRWYQTLWTALKYVFNNSSKFGAFEETVLDERAQSLLKSSLNGPIKMPERNTVYFDVDDTLVLWTVPAGQEEQAIRLVDDIGVVLALPHHKHIEAIKEHKARGHTVVVWSQGGSDWAELVVNTLNIRQYVDLIIDKPAWFYDDIPASMFMPESARYWRDPNKATKVIQPQNDYGNNPQDR